MSGIVGPQGAAGGGVSLYFDSDRVTNTSAPSQAKNWLVGFGTGVALFPSTSSSNAGIRIYTPFAGTIKTIRAARFATADDLTFAIEVNGTQRLSLLLPNGTGADSVTDNVNTYAVVLNDYITVSLTAATPDTSNFVFPQLVFLIE